MSKYDIITSGEKMNNKEYLQIVEKILNNRKFIKLKEEKHHHNSNRFNHSLEVSYTTYKICKKLKLNYKSAAKAALLHDFFFDKEFKNKKQQMFCHPKKALENAKKITTLTKKEENIITSHMCPIGRHIPKYKESIIVDLVDDYISLKEKFGIDYKNFKAAINFLFIVIINVLLK